MSLKHSILGMGNPLLDISADVDDAFLAKYEIKMADQILAEDKHLPMFKELADKPDVQYVPGGATQNSIRVAQWMLQVPGATAYMGAVGDDDFAKIMREQATADGVDVRYHTVADGTPSGTCAVAIKAKERSLVANLAAANKYDAAHLREPKNWALVEAARVCYSAGFFITVSPESMKAVAEHCSSNGKTYCLNLSAPFISEVPPFKATLLELIPHVDVLFGNETEARAFAATENWGTDDLGEIATRLAAFPKATGKRARTVVITHGSEPTVVFHQGKISLYPVPPVPSDEIVDTNGAGDAFVGGFLSQLVAGKEVAECCRAGNYAASVIIRRSGCALPPEPEFTWA